MAFDSHFLKRSLTALKQDDIEGRYVVALSGGADSTALLIALSECVSSEKVVALHFDHAIHSDSADWALDCQHLCAEKQIEFHTTRWKEEDMVIKQQEAAAREARYYWFAEKMGQGDLLLTGHHLDDQAETVLMSLFEGRSLNRVAGMRSLRQLQFGSHHIMVRPLLNVRRIELQQFLQDRGVAWIEDPANTSDSHARSWIRTEIVPLLIQRWPSVVENVDRVAGQLAEMLETVDDTACKEILSHARPLRRTLFCRAEPLFLPPLMSGSEGFFYIALRRWLHQGGVGSPGRKQLKELYRQLSNVGSAHHCRLYLGELEVIYFDQHLFLVEERQFSIPDGLKACADQNMICDRLNVTYTHSGEGFHKDVFQSHNVYWRMRRSNDRFTLSDKSGSMNLKKAMQQTKQVPWLRHSLPVLAQEHDIIWAHGLGVNTRFRVGGDQDRDGVLPMFKIT